MWSRRLTLSFLRTLIRLSDLANHKAGASNTCSIGVLGDTSSGGGARDAVKLVIDPLQLEGKKGAAVLTAGAELPAGAQVFIDYGEAGWRSSWEMLYTYGFVPGASGTEWAAAGGCPMFFKGISEKDPLYQQKRAVFDALAGGEDESCWAGMWIDLKSESTTCLAMVSHRCQRIHQERSAAEFAVQFLTVFCFASPLARGRLLFFALRSCHQKAPRLSCRL